MHAHVTQVTHTHRITHGLNAGDAVAQRVPVAAQFAGHARTAGAAARQPRGAPKAGDEGGAVRCRGAAAHKAIGRAAHTRRFPYCTVAGQVASLFFNGLQAPGCSNGLHAPGCSNGSQAPIC
eukprot:363309-Chlamydomonas_euryale.AAC.20